MKEEQTAAYVELALPVMCNSEGRGLFWAWHALKKPARYCPRAAGKKLAVENERCVIVLNAFQQQRRWRLTSSQRSVGETCRWSSVIVRGR